MKSFDRRSFGKLMLGAIPAVFLAKNLAALPAKIAPAWSAAKWQEYRKKYGWKTVDGGTLSYEQMTRYEPTVVEHQYSCGHFRIHESPGPSDPEGFTFSDARDRGCVITPNSVIPGKRYRITEPTPCSNCQKKARFANTLTQFL